MEKSDCSKVAAGLLRALDVTIPPEDRSAAGQQCGMLLRTRADQILFHQGDPSDAVYLLVTGELRCFVSHPDSDTGERNTLLLRAPALVGDRDALLRYPAMETVQLIGCAQLVVVEAQVFLETWAEEEKLRSVLATDLARRYARSLELSQLHAVPLADRVAAFAEDPFVVQAGQNPSSQRLSVLVNATPRSITRALATGPSEERLPRSLFHSFL
jgi:CRP-like cAMP-binding protein